MSLAYKNFFLVLLLLFTLTCCRQPSSWHDDWLLYKSSFIAADGRVIDTGNQGISHSEGQGYGMLLAAAAGDRGSFAQLWQWTGEHLRVRRDYLFAWKYVPGSGVADPNNASDGDLLIAWALLRAGKAWGRDDYLRQSKDILADIRNKLVRRWHGKTVLLPGEFGFARDDGLTINLSYWIFPAFAEFQNFDPSPLWAELIRDGLELQARARYGRWRLPPDWLDLDEEMAVSACHEPSYGYDAIRIPLYLAWGKRMSAADAEVFLAYAAQSRKEKGILAPRVNLLTEQLAEYDAPAGIKAVYRLLRSVADQREYSSDERLDKKDDYYSATLLLLTRLAAEK